MRDTDNLLSEIYKYLEVDNGQTLKDIVDSKIHELNITSHKLSQLIGIDKSTFNRIISGDTQKVDLFNILKISQFLGISIDEITRIYVSSLKPEFVGELEIARKANYIINTFDIDGLYKIGFLKSKTSILEIEKRIVTFFGLNTIFEYSESVSGVLFSRTRASSHDKMREFWVRSAHYQFKKINNPNEYNSEELQRIIPKIRSYTRYEENGLATVIHALYRIGVTVIVQGYLAKTQVMGGTFVVNNKPCIVLTDYNKRYPIIWTALMHELYHVLYDFEDLKGWVYHLSGESDTLLMREEDADFFAQEILFPEEKMNYIRHFIHDRAMVENFAKENKVHSSLIYHFYCLDVQRQSDDKVWGLFANLIPSTSRTIEAVSSNPFNKESIFEEIKTIKRRLETFEVM